MAMLCVPLGTASVVTRHRFVTYFNVNGNPAFWNRSDLLSHPLRECYRTVNLRRLIVFQAFFAFNVLQWNGTRVDFRKFRTARRFREVASGSSSDVSRLDVTRISLNGLEAGLFPVHQNSHFMRVFRMTMLV